MPHLDTEFLSQHLQRTFDDPGDYGVHLLFNAWWRYAPEDAISSYERQLLAMPGGNDFVSGGWFAPQQDLDALAAMPAGSLGNAYHRFLVANGLETNLAVNYRQLHDHMAAKGGLDRMPETIKYAILRGFQIHDLLHVLTGYRPDPGGELALQAFSLAQLQFPYFGMWMSVTTTRMTFLEPDTIVGVMDRITEGWQHGRATPNLAFERWEERFGEPLASLQAEFSVTPVGSEGERIR